MLLIIFSGVARIFVKRSPKNYRKFLPYKKKKEKQMLHK